MKVPSIDFSSIIWRNGMMECFILPNGTEKSRLSVVVIFSITTIVGDIPVPTALGLKFYAWVAQTLFQSSR